MIDRSHFVASFNHVNLLLVPKTDAPSPGDR